ncbi:hypothetical protein JR316_0004228 [Psilocybe cubensis]|uniref:Uncharacterized protein n=2 Tax=Psilocybe cubensis TaxID=181762 RepID=A0ACB8H2A9_PSICU|nr:hypothetical protein JR316_0004228 [Psilocybe cubensis]KAH9482133.1 hypothetical protein JR316_0004228 [Psilocybe cubensis]
MAPLPLINPPLENSSFNLDIFSIAGFFGGDEVLESMSTIHLTNGRRWRGWYNSPGAYTVAKSIGRIANSQFWRGIFPGSWKDPASSFGLDGKKGPQYVAVLSGTKMTSGYMGHLLAQYVKQLPDDVNLVEESRKTRSTAVTIIDIKNVEQLDHLSSRSSTLHLLLSYFTMISSVACAIFSLILFNDRFCFSAILLGTIIGGLSTWVVGTGKLTLQTVFKPAPGSPPGDGVLIGEEFTVLRGTEGHVNAITKGKFNLELRGGPNYHIVGICSLLYLLQFIAQLFLIPQGHLAGQIMFLCSFAISWIYNGAIASIDKEAMQTNLLRQSVTMDIKKYTLPNRTRAVVFTCLSLRRSLEEIEENPVYSDFNPETLLVTMLPNDTRVWRKWRQVVKDILLRKQPPEYFDDALDEADVADLREDQRNLLQTLLKDAKIAHKMYNNPDGKCTSN